MADPIVTLPKWMNTVKKVYVTSTGGDYNPRDVALALALTIRLHGTVDAIRQTARNLVDKVCREHKPNMRRLSRTAADAAVLEASQKIIDRVLTMTGVELDEPFALALSLEQPEPEADPADIAALLEEIASEKANPKQIAEEVMFLAEQLPHHQRAGLYLIAGSKNPRAVIMAMLRQQGIRDVRGDAQ